MGVMQYVPWWAKLWGKVALARLPVPYDFWRRMGLFRHGEMNVPERAINTFCNYFNRAQQYVSLTTGFTSLELGPGDSILSGLVARSMGAKTAYLSDAGNFADTNLDACHKTIALMRERGMNPPDISSAKNLQEVLALSNVNYLTRGTASLAEIPDASVDFFWSQVVLEHIPKNEFPLLLKELRRIAKPTAIGIHSIDFRDHLGGGLNNLRFDTKTWESPLFTRSGFYTNRLRPREMLTMLKDAGFAVDIIMEKRWPEMPISRKKIAAEFRNLPDEDFMVCEIEIVMKVRA